MTKSGEALLSVEAVTKTYEGRVVLDAVQLQCAAGERLAIMGPSGSGKSTLLNCLAGLETVDAGDIRFLGRSLGSMSEEEVTALRRGQLTSVFQFFHLLPTLRAEENVEFPLLLAGMDRRSRRQRVAALLEEVGLSGRHAAWPSQLSGGELQRLAIARALITEPALILADEPTGSLDSRNGELVLALMRQLTERHGTALILVTHDAEAAKICERRLRMRDGRLSEAGREDISA